jgi:hypothetical protein
MSSHLYKSKSDIKESALDSIRTEVHLTNSKVSNKNIGGILGKATSMKPNFSRFSLISGRDSLIGDGVHPI